MVKEVSDLDLDDLDDDMTNFSAMVDPKKG